MPSPCILIFPSSHADAKWQAARFRANGYKVVGASSLVLDGSSNDFDHWERLPWIETTEFPAHLDKLIQTAGLTHIASGHPSVLEWLDQWQKLHNTGITIVSLREGDNGSVYYRMIESTAVKLLSFVNTIKQTNITLQQIEAALYGFSEFEGQCSEDKMAALLMCGQTCPDGDIVEIGSLFGKSAFALGFFPIRNHKGRLLCIDPWPMTRPDQGQTRSNLASVSLNRDRTTVFKRFVARMTLHFSGSINYIRDTSDHAWKQYTSTPTISTTEFGTTDYEGNIACLHIDGNHALEYVQRDISQWVPRVKPSGWLIIDDYHWHYGDGPRQAADVLLTQHAHHFERGFFCGGALFLQRNSHPW